MRSDEPPIFRTCLRAVLLVLFGSAARGQEQTTLPSPIVNGDMESLEPDGRLRGWYVPPDLLEADHAIGPSSAEVHGGARSARLDSLRVEPGSSFGNLMQFVDAAPWRGGRVQLRAAVKVTEAGPGGHVRMWMRVDCPAPGETTTAAFFDDRNDRRVEAGDWKLVEISGDVPREAQNIALGFMTVGPCVAFVDDVTFEPADASTRKSARDTLSPPQPFFTAWLWLPAVAAALFGLGFLARGSLGTFAFRFTLVYWAQYAFPTLLAVLVPFVGERWSFSLLGGPLDALVRGTGTLVLGIQEARLSSVGMGSGDTTYAYVQAFMTLVLALLGALAWSLVDRSARARPRLEDLLRSALRYTLAIMMVRYGLAKLHTLGNQFSAPSAFRLAQPYGNSSPMGLLWTFMGASRPYTHFAGAMELLGGILLVWRRTAVLGALVSFGVMLNVMVLNFCYDTPVKLLSAHLCAAAVCIALPDAGRLVRALLGLATGPGGGPARPFTGKLATWVHRGLKAAFVLLVLVIPIGTVWSEERTLAPVLPVVGEWKLATLEIDGVAVVTTAGEVERLTLGRPVSSKGAWRMMSSAVLVGGEEAKVSASIRAERLLLDGRARSSARSKLLEGEYAWRIQDGALRLESPGLVATFTPIARDYLLMRRGFRWINERPFNR